MASEWRRSHTGKGPAPDTRLTNKLSMNADDHSSAATPKTPEWNDQPLNPGALDRRYTGRTFASPDGYAFAAVLGSQLDGGRGQLQKNSLPSSSSGVDPPPTRGRGRRCWNRFVTELASVGWFLCGWTRRLNKNVVRWPIQAMTTIGILSAVGLYGEGFLSDGAWIATTSAVMVLESTLGASMQKAVMRSGGSALGGLLGIALYALITLNEQKKSYAYVPYLIWITTIVLTLAMAILRHFTPNYPQLGLYGINLGITVIFASYFNDTENFDYVAFGLKRIAYAVLGVFTATIVFHTVLPNHARPRLIRGLADILRSFSELMEPLQTSQGGWTSSVSLLWPGAGDEQAGVSPVLLKWEQQMKKLQGAGELLLKQQTLVEAARHEYSLKKPHKFQYEKYDNALRGVRLLYHQVTTLFMHLDRDFHLAMAEATSPSRGKPSIAQMRAVQTAFAVWDTMYGPIMSSVLRHMIIAFRAMATAIEQRSSIFGAQSAVGAAGAAIDEFKRLSVKRRKQLGEIILRAAEAERSGEWKGGAQHLFESLLGFEPLTEMNYSGQSVFWEHYWEARDRITMSEQSLASLFVTLEQCSKFIEDLIGLPPERGSLFFVA